MYNEKISVVTPENVEFSFELAGIGSRFIGAIVDTIIQAVIIVAITIAASCAEQLLPGKWIEALEKYIPSSLSIWSAFAIILSFLVLWGYYIFFELIWNGQTPGKKAAGIRVMREGGYPIGVIEVLIRNLVRLADFLPYFYGVGIIAMLVNSKSKRLGDFAAGTIVVKEKKYALPPELSFTAHKGILNEEQSRLVVGNLMNLTREDYLVLRDFLLRRNGFKENVRFELSRKLTFTFIEKLQIDSLNAKAKEYYFDYEAFLEHLAYLFRENERYM